MRENLKGLTMPNENILNKIRSLFKLAEGEIPENASAAQIEVYQNEKTNALKMAHKFLQKYNVDRSQISITEEEINQSIDLSIMGRSIISYPFKKSSIWWKELAKIVAPSQFCRVIFDPYSDNISFCGLDLDRELAILQFNKFAEVAFNFCKIEMKNAKKMAGISAFDLVTGKTINHSEWISNDYFSEAFHYGFRKTLEEIFQEDKISNAVTDKLDKDVENYWRLQLSIGEDRRDFCEDYTRYEKLEIPTFTHAIEMGNKVAEKIADRTKKVNENIKAEALTRNSQIVQVKNVGTVFCLLDTSGSMSGDKISQAKRGIVDYAYQAFARGFKVGLAEFGGDTYWDITRTGAKLLIEPIDEISEEFTSIISSIKASGGTPMTEGIELVRQNLPKENGKKRTICLITDGMPDNKQSALFAAQMAKDDGIEIACIGTLDVDKDFIERLASRKELALLTDNVNFGNSIKKLALQLTA